MGISLKDFKITNEDLPLPLGWTEVKIVKAGLNPSKGDKNKINLLLELNRRHTIYILYKGYGGYALVLGKQRLALIAKAVGIEDVTKLEDTDQLIGKPFYIHAVSQKDNLQYIDIIDFLSVDEYKEREKELLAEEENRKNAAAQLEADLLKDIDF
ncbi:MAG: hypothetical protein [Caudoviricetes sp.]|nr:MAG: hypothetical protein [Caudoviricetes sp.]